MQDANKNKYSAYYMKKFSSTYLENFGQSLEETTFEHIANLQHYNYKVYMTKLLK